MVGRVIVVDDRPPVADNARAQCAEAPDDRDLAGRAFRTCPVTGRRIHRDAETLIKVERGRGGRRAADRRHRRPAARADPLAGRAPPARRLVLPHPRRARHEHADLLHHLLRDGGAAASPAPCCSTRGPRRRRLGWVDLRAHARRRADGRGRCMWSGQGRRALHVVPAAARRDPLFYLGIILFAVGALVVGRASSSPRW